MKKINCGKLCMNPTLKFTDEFNTSTSQYYSSQGKRSTSTVEFVTGSGPRFYDTKDYIKDKHKFPLRNIGNFNTLQCYYYNFNQFTTDYFVPTTDRQISGVVFNNTEKCYYGLVKDSVNIHTTKLETEWVELNFDKKFQHLIKNKADTDSKKCVKIPVGTAKPTSTLAGTEINPVIKYLQNNEDTCVFASIASAIHYMGYTDVAFGIKQFEILYQDTKYENNYYEHILGKLVRNIAALGIKRFNRGFQIQKIKKPNKFDIIEYATMQPDILFHVVLCGKNCSAHHCICIVNNLIFDGNYTNALPLSQESLNLCVDDIYLCIENGFKYVPYTKT